LTTYIISLIRTYVPLLVGAVLGWLASITVLHAWIVSLSTDEKSTVVTGATALLVAAYYGIVRFVETKYPKVGILLGKAATIAYGAKASTVIPGAGGAAVIVPPAV
jgi:hypothetical protein